MASQLCSEVNGGGCKHKVSARNGFVCAAGHSDGSIANIARPTIPISNMDQQDKEDLVTSTEDKSLQLELFRTGGWEVRRILATNPSIGEDLQWKLFRIGNLSVQQALARNPSIGEDLQWKLFRTGDLWVQAGLARNPSIGEDLQLELFRTGDFWVQAGLALNPSIDKDITIELIKVGQTPFGYTTNKPLEELMQPENLALLGQYPKAFSEAYLERLLDNPQEDKEESKVLTLHSYLVNEKSGGEDAESYKDRVLERYPDDQEVALILST